MKRIFPLMLSLLFMGGIAVFSPAARLATADETARAAVIKLFESLTEEQKKSALKEFADKDRHTEAFPAVNRPGIAYAKLTAEQKAMIDDIVKAMTSEYGYERCVQIPKETPEGQRFLTFFGTPSAKTPFAWRIGMHHLTLIYAEFGGEKSNEFGPILLGGNPVKTMWDEEEKLAMEMYGALTAEEAKTLAAATKGASPGSGGSMGKAGVKISDLNDKARKLAVDLLHKRLDVFSADRRKVIDELIERDGGAANLRLIVWGSIAKSQKEGGTYHWRIGGDSVICDWQTIGKNHVHMTLRGRQKK